MHVAYRPECVALLSYDGMQVEEFTGSQQEWDEFVAGNKGNHFQSYAWGDFRTQLGWKVHRLVVTDGSSIRLAGMFMARPLPAGFSFWYCPEGPVVSDGDWNDAKNQEAFQLFSDRLKELAKSGRSLFCKIDPHVKAEQFPVGWLTKLGWKDSPEDQQSALVVQVPLTGSEDEILAQMKQKGRYNIRYAQRKGVTTRTGTGQEELDTFYELHGAMAERQGITHRAKDYFEKIRQVLMEQYGIAHFIIAEYEGKPVAAIMNLYFGDEAVYQYGGSNEEHRNTMATYLIQWAGMLEGKQRGCKYYNLTGIAHSDDPNLPWAGLRQFKLKFGGEIVDLLGAYDYPYKPLLYHGFTQADRVRRKLAKRSQAGL
jgi:lipid II:glycine glycyltransferase (peptidoglycan interpeptide bridge formation enzyme)